MPPVCAALLVCSHLCENPHVRISGVIIAFNEEDKIGDAIRSLSFVDEVLVVDSESTDRTREIAENLGARVVIKPWAGFAEQKQFATDEAAHDQVLSLDADEQISGELRDEILRIKDSGTPADGYRIPRLAIYMGREVRHSGWYPDWQLRFFDRRKGRWKQVAIHESVEMDPGATIDRLRGNILHRTVETAAEHRHMIRTRYAPLGAAEMHRKGRTGSILNQCIMPPIAFLRSYILKAGILDGSAGAKISYFAAYNVYLKHKLLRQMHGK